jgi:alkanesulfonate monooxygenase SsuD/methylene tetrahydromethanopterin reductase-like flavin-dependent oxidoreductase (luciferase family)
VDFHGKYYSARECELRPRGPRRSGPPILIGARQPHMLRLTAQYADYWNIVRINDVENLIPVREAVNAACSKVGRDPATLQRTLTLLVDLPGSYQGPLPDELRRYRSIGTPPVTGTPEEMADLLRAFAREGVSHIQLWLEPNTMAAIDAFVPALELLDRG